MSKNCTFVPPERLHCMYKDYFYLTKQKNVVVIYVDRRQSNKPVCFIIYIIMYIYLLQLGCYPVAVVILHVNKT